MVRIKFILLLLLVAFAATAQQRVKLKKADNLIGGIKDGKRFDRVIGDVVFVQNKTTIYCDFGSFFQIRKPSRSLWQNPYHRGRFGGCNVCRFIV
ncbi:MAG: hypothetical protein U5K54_02135 [Cytophagales bacterium]|nr:hypothetical protein [Cytophagales bacterium]